MVKNMNNNFHYYKAKELDKYFSVRVDEIKIGEQVQTIDSTDPIVAIKNSSAKYILIGIPEDIGIRANLGKPGATTAWEQSLSALLSMQSNQFLNGEEILVLGYFDFTNLLQQSENKSIAELRETTAQIDKVVYQFIQSIYQNGKELIVIGGGHNNAYGLIKGIAKASANAINVINIDPHSDYRNKEGRHSGNGFRYAKEEGYLKNYALFGLHESYSPASVTAELLNNSEIRCFTYEEIKIRNKYTMLNALDSAIEFINDDLCGIEIDLDGVENIPASAATPCGWSTAEIRNMLHHASSRLSVAYLHLAEGAAELNPKVNTVGKLNAYLITDFIKARNAYLSKK
jgi:formiminoglutamase